MKEPIRIAIAESYALEREGLVRLLNDFEDLQLLYCAANGKELIKWLEKNTADILLFDLNLYTEEGKNTLIKIRQRHPQLKLIIFSEYFTERYITELVRSARAFLSKDNPITEIVETIRQVHADGISIDPLVYNLLTKKGVLTDPDFPGRDRADLKFSAKEILILRYMCKGKESREIAALTNNALKTIENHRSDIWRKSECATLPELMDFAFKHGLITF